MLAINIGSRFAVYTINIGVQFFLTPYIVLSLGAAEYGYLGLGQSFISYIDILTFVTAGTLFRFAMISFTQKRQDDVNEYFSSSIYSTLAYLLALVIPVSYAIWRLKDFIKINPSIVSDVQILFVLLMINFVFNTFFLIFRTGTQIVNKFYLISIRDFFSVILETILLLSMYIFFEPKIYYLGISAVFLSGLTMIYDFVLLKRFIPHLEIRIKHIKWNKLIDITSSGFYIMIKQTSNILLVGLDLLFANTMVSEIAMGQLSIGKILPKAMQSFLTMATGSFNVIFTKLYAQKKMDHLLVQIKRGIKVLGTITMIPNVILIVYGLPFYKLWLSHQNFELIYLLSVMTALVLVMTGLMFPLQSIFTITNHLKVNAIVHLIYGLVSVLTTFLILKYTNFGVYAIAGVSTFYGIMLPFVFQMPYAAHCLNLPKLTFFPLMFRSLLTFGVLVLFGFTMSRIFMPTTWIQLILSCGTLGLVGLGVVYFMYFTAEERGHILSIFGIKK